MPEANNEPLITDDDLNIIEETTPEPERILLEPEEVISLDGEPIPTPPTINDTPTGELAKRFNELQNKYELKLQQVQDLEEFLVNTQFQLTNKDTELKTLKFQFEDLSARLHYFTDATGFVTGQVMEFISKVVHGIPYEFMKSSLRQSLSHPNNASEAIQHNINANIQNVELLQAIGEGRVTINPGDSPIVNG